MSADLPDQDFLDLLELAQSGDTSALGQLLHAHRETLRQYAIANLDRRISKRIDASDVVQQTMLSACRNIMEFRGENADQLLAWILQIHKRNLLDNVREHLTAEKRNVQRESEVEVQQVSFGNEQSTPSQRAIKKEQANHLEELICRLPADQATVIRLRYINGCTLIEMAEQMKRSTAATASLLKRALVNLRQTSSG